MVPEFFAYCKNMLFSDHLDISLKKIYQQEHLFQIKLFHGLVVQSFYYSGKDVIKIER